MFSFFKKIRKDWEAGARKIKDIRPKSVTVVFHFTDMLDSSTGRL